MIIFVLDNFFMRITGLDTPFSSLESEVGRARGGRGLVVHERSHGIAKKRPRLHETTEYRDREKVSVTLETLSNKSREQKEHSSPHFF